MLKRTLLFGLFVFATACLMLPLAVHLTGWWRWALVVVWVLNSVMWAAFGAAEAFRWIVSEASPWRLEKWGQK